MVMVPALTTALGRLVGPMTSPSDPWSLASVVTVAVNGMPGRGGVPLPMSRVAVPENVATLSARRSRR